MTQPEPMGDADGGRREQTIDWIAAERSEEFRELVKRRRRFVVPATIFFLGWYSAFILLSGYAPEFMGTSLYQGLTVGYALALTQFLMVWLLGWLYLRRADREFDPLARRAAEKAIEAGAARSAAGEAAGGSGPDAVAGRPARAGDGGAAPGSEAAPASGSTDPSAGGPR